MPKHTDRRNARGTPCSAEHDQRRRGVDAMPHVGCGSQHRCLLAANVRRVVLRSRELGGVVRRRGRSYRLRGRLRFRRGVDRPGRAASSSHNNGSFRFYVVLRSAYPTPPHLRRRCGFGFVQPARAHFLLLLRLFLPLQPRRDIDLLILPGGDWQGGGAGGIADVAPGSALAAALSAQIDLSVSLNATVFGICTGFLFLTSQSPPSAGVAVAISRVDTAQPFTPMTLTNVNASAALLPCTYDDADTFALTNFNTLGVRRDDAEPEWTVLGTRSDLEAGAAAGGEWVELAKHATAPSVYGVQWHPYSAESSPTAPHAMRRSSPHALSSALIAGLTSEAAGVKVAGGLLADTRALRCLTEVLAGLGPHSTKRTSTSALVAGLVDVFAVPLAALNGSAQTILQIAIATVGANTAWDVLVMNGTAPNELAGATEEEVVALLSAAVNEDISTLISGGEGAVDLTIDHEGALSMGAIVELDSSTESELVLKAVALIKTAEEGGALFTHTT